MKSYEEQAKEILAGNIYMTIATASPDGTPWVSPVFFAYDDAYNLYWASERTSRHSKLIGDNNQIAIVVFDSSAPEGEGDAVYFEAHAEKLENLQEIKEAAALLGARVTKDEFRIQKIEEVSNEGAWRVYKAVPHAISKLTDGEYVNGQYVDRRVEIELK